MRAAVQVLCRNSNSTLGYGFSRTIDEDDEEAKEALATLAKA